MRVVAILNQKGGVGKTTTAVNLGAALALRGRRVLLVDIDPQCNLTDHLGLELGEDQPTMYDVLSGVASPTDGEEGTEPTRLQDIIESTETEGLFVAPGDEDLAGIDVELAGWPGREALLKRAIASLGPEPPYDWLIVDCPPSLGLLSLNAMTACPEIFITLQTEYFALRGLGQLTRIVGMVQGSIHPELKITGILATLVNPVTNLAREVLAEVREHFGGRVFATRIRQNVRLAEAPGHGQHIFQYAPQSAGAADYRALAAEVEPEGEEDVARPPAPASPAAGNGREETPPAPAPTPTPSALALALALTLAGRGPPGVVNAHSFASGSSASTRARIDAFVHEATDPRGAIVVAHPHPAHGGHMDHPVVLAVAERAVHAGLTALRFDFRGVRRSQGDVQDAEGHLADLRQACAETRRLVPEGTLLGAGFSYGARTFAQAVAPEADDRPPVLGLLLLAPAIRVPRTARDFGNLLLGRPLDEAARDAPAVEALGRIPVRTRVLVGDRDVVAPVDDLAEALSPAAALTVLAGLNHFFSRGTGASATALDVLEPAIDRALAALA